MARIINKPVPGSSAKTVEESKGKIKNWIKAR